MDRDGRASAVGMTHHVVAACNARYLEPCPF
jgi:hypothetical protein